MIVKITRPQLSEVVQRTRLFLRLDQIRQESPVAWISGPAGSGKTTLLASYLDAKNLPCLWYHLDEGDGDIATFFRYLGEAAKKAAPGKHGPLPLLTMEYLRRISTFSRRYFETLFSRLKPPYVLVFGNYHHVPADSLFHDTLGEALSVIPPGITVMISSRSAVPPALARLSVYNKIRLLGGDDLRFDAEETKALFNAKCRKVNDADLARIERLTTGWAAGLDLLAERLRTGAAPPEALDQTGPGDFVDFFAAELFSKVDGDMQEFLLKTSFLQPIDPRAAIELTGNEQAGSVLAELSRGNFFTERSSKADPLYRYHPLFREFLQARAQQVFTPIEMSAIMRTAAVLLDEAGQIEDAADLYLRTEDWERLAGLIAEHARCLAAQGRTRWLEQRLSSLPPAVLDHDPWLLYWTGICRMNLQLPEARNYFKRACNLFRLQRDAEGIFLSWCGAVESIVQDKGRTRELARWRALADTLMREYAFPSLQIEDQVTAWLFIVSQFEKEGGPQSGIRRRRALTLLESEGDIGLRVNLGWHLVFYHAWKGEYAAGEHILSLTRLLRKKGGNASSPAHLWGMVAEGFFSLQKGSFEAVLRTMSEVLAKSEESGVHRWDTVMRCGGVQASLYNGDVPEADRLLGRLASGMKGADILDRFIYYDTLSLRYFFVNELPQAIAHQEAALALAPETGIPFFEALSNFAMAQLMRAKGDRAGAREHNAQCRAIGRGLGSPILEFMGLLAEAAIAFDEADELQGFACLKEALSLGREKGYLFFNWRHPSLLLPLCVKAFEADIETGYVTELVRACNAAPAEPPVHIEQWPWAIQIYTLGRFALLKGGERVIFSGKVQKKPLDLLKALISFGGEGVSEELVIYALWPDADGDMARISFKTTLHRLRQFMGREAIVQSQKGRMSLDRRHCWVDVWAFEGMVRQLENRSLSGVVRERIGDAEEGVKKGNRIPSPSRHDSLLLRNAEKAVALYHGHFLDNDENKPWTAPLRERLRNKHVFAVNAWGDYWLQRYETMRYSPSPGYDPQSAIRRAIACFETGLEIDDVTEEFYRKLMICHHRMDNNAEAVKVYHRCRNAIASVLGVQLSEKMERLYSRIRSAGDASDGFMYYI